MSIEVGQANVIVNRVGGERQNIRVCACVREREAVP